MRWVLPLTVFLFLICSSAISQNTESPATNATDPKIAFLKSLAVPGWGHHHVDKTDWARGQYHLAAEATLLLSFVGLSIHSNNLQQNWFTYARTEAGVDIENRNRAFRLAVGDFKNLDTYNDYQERSRNWDQLYEDVPDNRWNWGSTQARDEFSNLRQRFEKIDQQLPALLSLMVLNRVISAISAYNRARKRGDTVPSSALHITPYGGTGLVASLRIRF